MMSFMPSAAEPTRKWQVPIMQHRHFTSPASSGPPRDPVPPSQAPPPPAWRWWLVLFGLLATVLLLWSPSMKSTTTFSFNYSKFLAQVDANKVKTAAIDPNGGVTGTLRNGDDYTTQIPVVLNDAS